MTENSHDKQENMTGRPVIFGEVLFDRFPDGTAVLGGAPFNVAWHLQGFGCAPLLLSRVGDDEPGHKVRQAMHDWNLDTVGVQTDPAHPTGAVEITFEGGHHSFDILPDQAYDHIDPALTRRCTQGVDAALLYHGSLVIRTQKVHGALDDLLAAFAAPVFVDINLRDPWWRLEDLPPLFDRARWLKVNDAELNLIAGQFGIATQRLEEAARALRAAHDIALLIVTRGARGALAIDASDAAVAVEPEGITEVIDTVGAGDAFASVVLLGLLRGWPLPSIMQRAQDFASRICGQRGATRTDLTIYREMKRLWGQLH